MTSTPSRGELQRGAAADAAVGAGDECDLGHGGHGAARPARAYQRPLQPGTSCPWLTRAPAFASWGAWTATDSPTSCAAGARRCSPTTSASPPGRRRRTRRAAPRGGRRARLHVDRLLHAARAGPRLAAVRADGRRDRPRAAAHARRARPSASGSPATSRPPRGVRSDHVSPALMRVLDRLDTPAQVVTDLGVTLRQNPLAAALLGVQTEYSGLRRSIVLPLVHRPRRAPPLPGGRRRALAQLRRHPARRSIARDPDDHEAQRPRRPRCSREPRVRRALGPSTRSRAARRHRASASPTPRWAR